MEDKPVKTATENLLDDYEEIIRRPVLDDQAKEEAAKLEESLVKEFHTLGGEGDPDSLQAAYSRLEKLAEENPYTKLRLGWVRNRAKSDYAYVLSISAALTSKEESLRLFEELALSSPSHKGYADNVRIIKKQIADYYLRMGEKGDFGSAIYAEKLYRELAEQNPDRKYEEFINKAKSLCDETKLVPGVGRLPYPAYRGTEPYVFVSYAHLDQESVFAEIKRFNEAGFHVWYDEGISPGNEWTDEIADALDGCSLFVVMITPTSAPRKNVLNEINFALDENKPFLAIHLEETEIKRGLKLRIGSNQAILKYNMTEEEYEYKYIEAFTRLGLVRSETVLPASKTTPNTVTSVPISRILDGKHPFGDYVPKGTAVITDGLGKEFTAIGNSLVYKPAGKIVFQTLHDLSSMEKALNGYVLKDALGRESLLKTSPGDELLFLGATENQGLGALNPEKLQINMVRSVRVDPGNTPGRRIKYCAVRVQNSAFLSPCQFLFFSVNENKGAPPVMKLKKDLNKFSTKGYASLGMMKKLTVVKLGEAAGPYGDRRPLDVTVQYLGDDIETFTIDDYFAIYAMGAGGEVHQLKREELSEIEIL